jgi:hypothetical protein
MDKPLPPLPNENLLEMYHFHESIQSMRQGLIEMSYGLREFQAGMENLRVLFEKIKEELAILERSGDVRTERSGVEGRRSVGETGPGQNGGRPDDDILE